MLGFRYIPRFRFAIGCSTISFLLALAGCGARSQLDDSQLQAIGGSSSPAWAAGGAGTLALGGHSVVGTTSSAFTGGASFGSGGTSSTGGRQATGGTSLRSGGTSSTGGRQATGGRSGGTLSTGGSQPIGGRSGGTPGTGGSTANVCKSDADCVAVMPVDLCQGAWNCMQGACVRDAKTAVDCSLVTPKECYDVKCAPATGLCEQVPTAQSRSCGTDYCTAGTCNPGVGQCKPAVACPGCSTCDPSTAACVTQAGWCRIAGSCVQVGTANPSNVCMVCNSQSSSDWSPAPSGTKCSKVDSCFTSFACDSAGTCQGDGAVAPSVPTPIRPISGTRSGSPWAPQSSNTLRPLFVWSATAGGSCPVTYDLQVDDSCSPGSTCSFASPEIDEKGLTTATYRPSVDLGVDLTPPVGRRYTWRVRACRKSSCSAWSSTRYVHVGRAPHDYNGDGYSDLVVNAFSGGKTFVHFGSANGVSLTGVQVAADRTVRNGTTGDVNGDGYSDLVVFSWHDNQLPHGKINTYLGSASGLPTYPDGIATRSADDYQPIFAEADFEGDGYNDLVANTGYADAMADYFRGSASGLPASVTLTLPNPSPGYSMNIRRMKSGDFNADAISDLVANAYFLGETVVYVSSGGLPRTPSTTISGITKTTNDNPCIAIVDSNLDHRDDLVLGLNGNVYSFTAQATGFSTVPTQTYVSVAPVSDNYGTDCLGAVLDTGVNDISLVISSTSTAEGGSIYFYGGTAMVAVVQFRLTNPVRINDYFFGNPIQVPGDLNGDGNDDLVVCDAQHASGTGIAWIYYGRPTADTEGHPVSAPGPSLTFCNDLF